MDGTESEGAALAKRQPAPAGALWEAVRAQLEDQHAATPEVSGGAPRPVQKVRREIALEIETQLPSRMADQAVGAVLHRPGHLGDGLWPGRLGVPTARGPGRVLGDREDLPLASDRTAAVPADEQSPSAAETPAAPTATAPDPSPYDNAAIIERPRAADWAPGGAAPPVQKDRRSSSRSRD